MLRRLVHQLLRSLVINRNESISDVSNDVLITKIKASSPNDERTKYGAEEPGLLLHNIILIILYLPPSLECSLTGEQ